MMINRPRPIIIVLVSFFTLLIVGIKLLSLPNSIIVQEFNKRHKKFEKLRYSLTRFPNFDFVMRYDITDILANRVFRDNMKIMINEYYSKDWFQKPRFAKFDSKYESIYSFEYENRLRKTYSYADIEKEIKFEVIDLKTLFSQMRQCNVNVIRKIGDVIEFSNESFLNSTSLSCYDGYLFYSGPRSNLEKDKNYSDLKEVSKNWFQFRRENFLFAKWEQQSQSP